MAQPQYNDTDFTSLNNHVFDVNIDTFAAGTFNFFSDGGPYPGSGVSATAVRDAIKAAIDGGTHVGWTAVTQGTTAVRVTATGPGQHIGAGPGGLDSFSPSVSAPPGGAISITDVVPFEGIDVESLIQTVEADPLILTPLVPRSACQFKYVTTESSPRIVEFEFTADPLPAAEKTALDALVDTYTNVDTASIFIQFARTVAQDSSFAHLLADLVLASKGPPDFGLKLISLNLPLGATKGYITGLLARSNQPTDDSEVVIVPGCCADDTNVVLMALTANKVIDIDVSGAGGLDTGSKSNSTFYDIYLISKLDGTTTGLFVLEDDAPDMPTDYIFKRWIGSALTFSTGDIIDFRIYDDGSDITYVWAQDRTELPFRVKSNGSATVFTDIVTSGAAPSRAHELRLVINNVASPAVFIRERDSVGGIDQYEGTIRVNGDQSDNPFIGVDSERKFQYCMSSSGGSVYIDVVGYKVHR